MKRTINSLPHLKLRQATSSRLPALTAFLLATLPAFTSRGDELTDATRSPTENRPQMVLQLGHSDWVQALDFSPDGATAISGGKDKALKVWIVATGELKATLLEHDHVIIALAYAPDGKTFASVGDGDTETDGEVILWDAATLKPMRRIAHPPGVTVSCLAYSPDSKVVACGSSKGFDEGSFIRFLDVDTGKSLRTQTLRRFSLSSIAYSPDGHRLALGGGIEGPSPEEARAECRILNARNGQWIRTLKADYQVAKYFYQRIAALDYSPDGKLLASANLLANSGDAAASIMVWNAATGQLQRTLTQNTVVSTLAFGSDSKTLASSGSLMSLGEVKIWEVTSGKLQQTLNGKTFDDFSAAFSPDGNTLAIPTIAEIQPGGAVGHKPTPTNIAAPMPVGTLVFWDLRAGTALQIPGRSESLRTIASLDGQRLVSAGESETNAPTTRIWDTTTGQLEFALPGGAPVAVAPDGRSIALRGKVKQSRQVRRQGRLAAVTENVDVVWVRSTETGKLMRTFSAGIVETRGNMAFSPNGKLLAIKEGVDPNASGPQKTRHGGLALYDVATGKRLRVIETNVGLDSPAVVFAPDGKSVATAGQDMRRPGPCAARIWSTDTGRLLKELKISGLQPSSNSIDALAFSPDGSILAGRELFGTTLWNAHTGKLLRTLKETGFAGPVVSDSNGILPLAFSPDGKVLATETSTKAVRLWRVADGKLLHEMTGHADGVSALAFIARGKVVVSAGVDNTMKFWDTSSGSLLATHMALAPAAKPGQVPSIEWIAFTPAGHYDASPRAGKFIRWRSGDELLPAHKLETEMRQPEKVRAALSGG